MVTQSLSHHGCDSPTPHSTWVATAAPITTVLALLTLLVLALVALTPAPSREITGSDLDRAKKLRHHGRDAISAPVAFSGVATTPGASTDWWSTVQEDLARREYEARHGAEDGTLQAANRAQDFRTYYQPGGIAVIPRGTGRAASGSAAESGDSWELTWRTLGWGRPGAMTEIDQKMAAQTHPEANGARVTYVHAGPKGSLSEWYENRQEGLEQGFTVHHRPAGKGEVRIEGAISGDLRAEPGDERSLSFVDADGVEVLRYGGLCVWDATHKELPAKLAIEDDRLAILIDDHGAHYPLTVDPLLSSPSWIAELNQAEAYFAFAVATAGDVNRDGYSDALVGSLQYDNGETNEGGAFLYLGSPSGLATSFVWSTESNQEEGRLGASLASAGDINADGFGDVLIGDFAYDNGEVNEGRVYVFHGSAAGLSTTPAWTAESNQENAWFGNSVATAGDVNGDGFGDVIIGAYNYDNGESDEGRAYVYLGSASGLGNSPAWIGESNQVEAYYGYSCATAGDVNSDGFSDVIVGSQFFDNGQDTEGRAFVYMGSAAGLSTTPAWTAESNQDGGWFGYSVSTAGDVNGDGFSDVVIGAIFYENGQISEGRAYLYQGSATGLALNPAWTSEGNQQGAGFGSKVAPAGDVNGDGFADVIVTALSFDNGEADEGRSYVFEGSALGLRSIPVWTFETNQIGANINWAMTAGDVNGDGFSDVIIGSYLYDGGQTNEGRAFVYHGAPTGLSSVRGWDVESNQSGAGLGFSVATAGDVNGDGYSDVIVGTSGYDNGQSQEGAAFAYLGSPLGLSTVPAWSAESNQVDALFGTAVGSAGDVNGDGYYDVVVGSYFYDNGQIDEGRAFVYLGSPGGLGPTPAWTAESNQIDAQFGWSVAGCGDVNGDGFSDVVVGAIQHDNGQNGEGRAFVYHGSLAGLSPTASWTGESNQNGGAFGTSVAGAGDVNGDGFSDLIVGAANYANGQVQEGRAFVYHGSPAGLATVEAWTAESNQAVAVFGISVASAGDVNGDGFSDVIIGAYSYDNGELNEGRAFAYLGSSGGLAVAPAWTAESNQADANFGFSVASAGDVNGDGFSDVIVGAYLYDIDSNHLNTGQAFAYQGSPSGLAVDPNWITEGSDGPVANWFIGLSVGTAGDVNGDGFSDVIVGAPGYHSPMDTDEGRVLVYYGNGGDGLDRIARQARLDNATPIAHLGLTDSETAFRLRALGRTPAGRGMVRLQYEVKPAGVPFNGQGILAGPFADTGFPSPNGSAVALARTQANLDPNTLYHWRVRIGTNSPFFPRSPWLTLPYNAVTEADVRTSGATAGIDPKVSSPARHVMIEPAAPNPFSGSTQLAYTLAQAGHGRLAVYDVQGRVVAQLMDGVQRAGRHSHRWDGRDHQGRLLPAGTYFLRLEFAGREETQKLSLLR